MVPSFSLYLRALSRMLTKTCRSRFLSPNTGETNSGSSLSRVTPSRLARSPNMMSTSSSSARTSIFESTRVSRPLCIREKSSSSSTIPERRSVSLRMTWMPRSTVSRFSTGSASRTVSPQPLMAVRGVRSSWETWEMNSFFTSSAFCNSSAR